MTFAAFEESGVSGAPVNLFLFRYGTGVDAYYAYTDSTTPVVRGAITYAPSPVTHEGVVTSGSVDNAEVTVRLPSASGLASLFRSYPPGQIVTLTVFQTHLNDPDAETLAVWIGRVLGPQRRGSEVSLVCEPISTSIERAGLRRMYQTTCPHLLFGTACGVSKAAFVRTATASTVGASEIGVSGGWNGALGTGKYANGTVEWDTPDGVIVRTILRVPTSTQLALSGPTTGLEVGDPVRIYPGCNHNRSDCDTIYENIVAFGGFPYIPFENPISKNPYN